MRLIEKHLIMIEMTERDIHELSVAIGKSSRANRADCFGSEHIPQDEDGNDVFDRIYEVVS